MSTLTAIDSFHALHICLGDDRPKPLLLTVLDLIQQPHPTPGCRLAGLVRHRKQAVRHGAGLQPGPIQLPRGHALGYSPDQVLTTIAEVYARESWNVYFQPDLLRNTELRHKIK